jgi:lysophospholipase L1-like esterase
MPEVPSNQEKSMTHQRNEGVARLAAFLLPWLLSGTIHAAPQQPAPRWVAGWAAAPQAVPTAPGTPAFNRAPALEDQTVRQIVYPSIAGGRVRLRISNLFDDAPLSIAAASIGEQRAGAALRPGTARPLTFAGRADVTVPPHGEIETDPVTFPVSRDKAIAVSLYVRARQVPLTWHKIASQTNYLSVAGNHVQDEGGAAFTRPLTSYIWLSGLSATSEDGYAVAAIGDSITDGMRSSLNANRRWPDRLAHRLAAEGQVSAAVVNLGISGNRLLNGSACYGQSVSDRMQRDAFSQPGVRYAILLAGINDINFSAMPPRRGLDCDTPHTNVSADDLIAGYRRLLADAQRRHVELIVATLTPAALPPEREAKRQAVNHWLRTSGVFTRIVDFDAAVRDPARPERLLRRYDSGDNIHPSDAGYRAMGDAVPLGYFQPR